MKNSATTLFGSLVAKVTEVQALDKALLAVGFKYDAAGKIFVLSGENDETIVVIPRSNARSFVEVATLIGAMTFNPNASESERRICGRVNLQLNEYLNQYQDRQDSGNR